MILKVNNLYLLSVYIIWIRIKITYSADETTRDHNISLSYKKIVKYFIKSLSGLFQIEMYKKWVKIVSDASVSVE